MSSWGKKAGGRRQKHGGGGGQKSNKSFRRPPYPVRQERTEEHLQLESFQSLEETIDYSSIVDYEHSSHKITGLPSASREQYDVSTQHPELYERFYQQLCGESARRPADCVVLSVNNQDVEYPKSLGQCLQELGLTVEMLYLQSESGLTRALQDVRSDGSPFCILVEQTNVTLSSCTVIIFSESLKIHRNMPKEHAMEFVLTEYGRQSSPQRALNPTEAATRAAELTEDYLERGKLERHTVPFTTRHLLFLLAEGLHLYPEEVSTLAVFLQNRQDHLQASSTAVDREAAPLINSLPTGLGKPPPLLPAGTGPAPREQINTPSSSGDVSSGLQIGLTGTFPKTKPPPLLSMQNLKPPSHRLSAPHSLLPSLAQSSRGAAASHGLDKPQPLLGPGSTFVPAPSSARPGALLDTPLLSFQSSRGLLPHPGAHLLRSSLLTRVLPLQNGPHGPRAAPPQLRSLQMGAQTGPRPLRRLLP